MNFITHIRSIRTIGIFIIVFSLAGGVHGEVVSTSTPAIPQKIKERRVASVLLADVNFSNVQATTTKGVVSGTFSVTSSLGDVSSSKYGIVIKGDTNGKDLYNVVLGTIPKLVQGTPISLAFNNNLPVSLPENGKMYLALYSERGINLAVSPLGVVPHGLSKVTCSKTQETITCSSSIETTVTVEVFEINSFGKKVFTKDMALSLNKETQVFGDDIMNTLSPMVYQVTISSSHVKNDDGKETHIFNVVKPGNFAKILSSTTHIISTSTKPQLETIVYLTSNHFGTSSPFTLKAEVSSIDEKCKTTSQEVTGIIKPVQVLKIASECSKGIVTVSLYSSGIVLDSSVEVFDLQLKKSEYSFSRNSIIVIILLIVISISFIIMKKRNAVVTALFIVMSLLTSTHTHAATFSLASAGIPCYMGGTTMAEPQIDSCWDADIVMTVDSLSKTAGQNFTVTISSPLGWYYSPTTSFPNSISAILTGFGSVLGEGASSQMTTFQAPNTPGTYSLDLDSFSTTINTYHVNNGGCVFLAPQWQHVSVWPCGIASAYISGPTLTVTAPTPTVNLFFSFLKDFTHRTIFN